MERGGAFQGYRNTMFVFLPQNIVMLTKNVRLVLVNLSQFKMIEGN